MSRGVVRSARPLGSEARERLRVEHERERNRFFMETHRDEAVRCSCAGDDERALAAALEALRFAELVFDAASIDLIPAFMLCGRILVQLRQLKQAERYLSQAQWLVLKNSAACAAATKSRLYHDLAVLYLARGMAAEALRLAADNIYHCALAYGADSVRAAAGYFTMATVFLHGGQTDTGLAIYGKVVKLWQTFLTDKLRAPGERFQLDEARGVEAVRQLQHILAAREEKLGAYHILTSQVHYVLAMLCFTIERDDAAHTFCARALEVADQQLGAEHATTKEIAEFLRRVPVPASPGL